MNINDDVIREWFYRLPKGYAEAPYSDSELSVLADVIVEHDATIKKVIPEAVELVTEEDGQVDIDDEEETFEIEENVLVDESADILMEGYTKEDLIAIIKEVPLSDKFMAYLARLIDSTSSENSVIDNLKARNFDEQSAKQIFSKSVEMDSYKQLRDLVTGQVNSIDFDSLGTEGNLNTFIKKIGFSDEYIDWLYMYQPPRGGVATGTGENLLCIILKGGHVPTKGDVGTENVNIELKSSNSTSSGFRLRGQSGYGSGYDVAIAVFKAIADIYGDALPEDFPDITKDKSIQLYSNPESLADRYFKDLKSKNIISTSEIADIYTNALKKLFKNYSGDIKSDIFTPSINSDGSINNTKLLPRLAALEFKYYAELEPWDVLMVLNYKREYLIIKKDATYDELIKVFEDNLKIVGMPNTKPKATSQDSVSKIQLKAK
jgi:hypothetical protein